MNTQNGSSNSRALASFLPACRLTLHLREQRFSPSIRGGYFTPTKEGFTQNTQVMVNGSARNVVLFVTRFKVKTRG